MAEIDDYLQPRAAITENVDLQHIQEVGGFCPLCGKQLLVKKGSKVNKQYQIAHIYPNSPNAHQKVELAGLERLGNTRTGGLMKRTGHIFSFRWKRLWKCLTVAGIRR